MPATALLHIPHAASLGSSLDSFFDAAETFFSNLAAVHWGALAFGLALHLCHLLCRSRAWFNVLRAAYPHERFAWRRIAGAYVAGVGVNSILPARAGDVTKIYLAKHSVPNSTYPAVTSSFFVDSVFDTLAGLREQGLTILLVEQRAQRTVALADRTHVLVGGVLRMTLGPADAEDTDKIISAYLAS